MSHFGNERLKTAPYIDMYAFFFLRNHIYALTSKFISFPPTWVKKIKKKNEKEKGSLKCNGSCN